MNRHIWPLLLKSVITACVGPLVFSQWLQPPWGPCFSVSDYSLHEVHGFQSSDYSFCGAYGFQLVITDSIGPLVFCQWLQPSWGLWFSVSDYILHGAYGFQWVITGSMGPLVFCQWIQPPWGLWFSVSDYSLHGAYGLMGGKIIAFLCYICN